MTKSTTEALPAEAAANEPDKPVRGIKPDDGAKVLTQCLSRIEQVDPMWQEFVVDSLVSWLSARQNASTQGQLPGMHAGDEA